MEVLQDVYPSRVIDSTSILKRQDPVIHSAGAPKSGITSEQAESYRRDGFLSIPVLFTPEEVKVLTGELDRLTNDPAMADAEESITEPGSGIVRSIFQVHEISPLFSRLARDQRLMDIARYLLNDDVYIHQSRVNLKPGFAGKEFYWHSDFETWHVEDGMPRMRAVSISIALTENNEFNGPLMLMPGSQEHYITCIGKTPEDHYKESLRKQEYGVPDHDGLRFLVNRGGIVAPKGAAGSATIFDCNTMHGSNSNISPFPRSNVFFVYNSVENRLVDPFGGTAPRPEFIATREKMTALEPLPRGAFAQEQS